MEKSSINFKLPMNFGRIPTAGHTLDAPQMVSPSTATEVPPDPSLLNKGLAGKAKRCRLAVMTSPAATSGLTPCKANWTQASFDKWMVSAPLKIRLSQIEAMSGREIEQINEFAQQRLTQLQGLNTPECLSSIMQLQSISFACHLAQSTFSIFDKKNLQVSSLAKQAVEKFILEPSLTKKFAAKFPTLFDGALSALQRTEATNVDVSANLSSSVALQLALINAALCPSLGVQRSKQNVLEARSKLSELLAFPIACREIAYVLSTSPELMGNRASDILGTFKPEQLKLLGEQITPAVISDTSGRSGELHAQIEFTLTMIKANLKAISLHPEQKNAGSKNIYDLAQKLFALFDSNYGVEGLAEVLIKPNSVLANTLLELLMVKAKDVQPNKVKSALLKKGDSQAHFDIYMELMIRDAEFFPTQHAELLDAMLDPPKKKEFDEFVGAVKKALEQSSFSKRGVVRLVEIAHKKPIYALLLPHVLDAVARAPHLFRDSNLIQKIHELLLTHANGQADLFGGVHFTSWIEEQQARFNKYLNTQNLPTS